MQNNDTLDTPVNQPGELHKVAIDALIAQVSAEIAATATPTSALLDGTARQRRDLRILARRLNGITAKYGVTLEQAIREAQASDRPIVVTLDMAEAAIDPVAVSTPDDTTAPAEVTAAQVTDTAESRLVVTRRGHYFSLDDPMHPFHNDHVCRGCAHYGHFDYILDYKPCANPFTGFAGLELDQVA